MPQDPKLERVPTFLETLIQSLLPNMADPVAMEDNARLLQQGGSGNTPERMKKILTVAGRGVADAAFGAAKSQVPESPEDIALQFGPLGPALAGLPFAAYKKFLPHGKLFHGSPSAGKIAETGIDVSRFDTDDVLGSWFHAAEDPEYANEYANGMKRGGKSAGVLPLTPKAENVLDLVEPNLEDMATAIGQMDERSRFHLLERYKKARRELPENFPTSPEQSDAELGLLRSHGLSPVHHSPGSITKENLPVKVLAEHVRLSPEQLNNLPFDAIRYKDNQYNSWAMKPEGVISTAYGGEIPFVGTTDRLPNTKIIVDQSGGAVRMERSPQWWDSGVYEPINSGAIEAENQAHKRSFMGEKRLAALPVTQQREIRGLPAVFSDQAIAGQREQIEGLFRLFSDPKLKMDTSHSMIDPLARLFSAYNPDTALNVVKPNALVPMRRIVLDKP